MNYAFHLLVFFSVYAIVTQGLNITVGYCGLLTLAAAGYYAIGAYAYAISVVGWGWSAWGGLLFAVVIGGVLSFLVTIPTWRLNGDFFVIATLAVQVFIYSAIRNWNGIDKDFGTLGNLTNGPFGIASIPRPEPGAWFDNLPAFAMLCAMFAIATMAICHRLLKSSWGLALKSVRDDELVARGIGQPAHSLKAQAVFATSAFAALAGALYASYTSFISPDMALIDESILLLSMLLVGGTGNIRGPIVGAVFLVAVPEIVRLLPIADAFASEIRVIIYGAVLVLCVHFMPNGIAGGKTA